MKMGAWQEVDVVDFMDLVDAKVEGSSNFRVIDAEAEMRGLTVFVSFELQTMKTSACCLKFAPLFFLCVSAGEFPFGCGSATLRF